ncbi:Rz1-like lysis system protein LysC [Asticcacaulis sp.]|uniref:Rz1-like lysis system protein LysC n=1 Tax=Asticcacaulis sp. TaxID=1872648 RepID=UPI003BB8F5F2
MLSVALTACGERPKPAIEYRYVSDLPDEKLVKDCDTSERDPVNNGALSDELSLTREQRDGCASQVKGIKAWRAGAVGRAKLK